MADAAQNAPPAPAVTTESRSETPKTEPVATATPPTPSVKTEGPSPQRLGTVPTKPTSSDSPAAIQTPVATTISQVKTEPGKPSDAATSAELPASATPASTNGTGASSTPAAVVIPTSSVPTITSPAPAATSEPPLALDSTPAKRSRSPEPGDEQTTEKRQKTEHMAEQQTTQNVETKVESEPESSGLFSWDLGAQLSSVLGSVEPEPVKETNTVVEDTAMEIMPTIPLLPPPRKRPEKMKFIENPTYFSRAMALPMLGSLSVQILLALFQQPSEVTDRQIRDVRTEGGKVYSLLRQTFMAVLKLFTEVTAFLSADDLDIHDPGDRETIQMANLASMCASFYGPGGPTMATAHDNFLKIMIPENGMITEDISALYLDQKTQSFLAYANVMEDKESTRNSLMDKFFPLDLETKLKEYWKDSNLTMSAEEFVKPFTDRRNLLKAIGHDKEKRKALEAKYQFATFLDNLSAFIRSNFDSILDYAESHGFEVPNEAGEEDLMLMDAVAASSYQGSFPGQPRRPNGPDVGYDSQGLASLISEKLNGYDGFSFGYGSSSGAGIPESTTLPPTQSLPTSVLYERARQAAVAKSSAHARREGLHSTRRPWTPEEEKALMAGLDMVKGPHWSQILQLFGQNGTISDILKDRTQVQLKDKARNLKLFFLKTNSEMPYYLQCVTGELKTRAPSQAARKEAEEQARVQAGGSPVTYASTYANGTTNGAGPLAHGLSIAGSPRPSPTAGTTGPSTPVAANSAHHQPQQSYQQQGYQHQQSYQQQRPQQLQPAANGATHSPHTPSQQAASKPLPPQPQHHQPIAPAPSYQRPLQQAPTSTTPQYQQRPVQQPATQAPGTYQQTQQHVQRPAVPSPASNLPPRPAPASTTPQTQSRPPAAIAAQTPSAATRPAAVPTTVPPRQNSIPAQGLTHSPASALASALKSVPTIMPAPPSSTLSSPAIPPAKPIQQPLTKPSYPTTQTGAGNHIQHPVSTPVAVTNTTVATAAPAPASKPPPAPAPAPVPVPVPAVPAALDGQENTVEKTTDAADELLVKSLQAVLDS